MSVPTSSPSAQGVDPAGIAALVDALEADPRIEPHGLIIQRHGVRIAAAAWAPHTTDRIRLVYSLSKSFTGTALGLQLGEGRLTLDDLVSDHLPELFEGADPRTRQLRVRHLASMATGHDHETLLEAFALDRTNVLRGFFAIPPDQDPGSVFAYNQPPVLALATILQRLAGQRLSEYLRPRVLEPIGVPDLRWSEYRPGIEFGFSGVYTNLDAVARLGQLYLDDGVWAGRRVLPAGWVAEASHPQVANPGEPNPDWQQGYGFQLWMSRHGYRGDGAFGQLMVVLPEHDTVVAMFACTPEMQAELDHVWTHLLPALRPTALPAGPGDDALAEQLAALALPTARDRVGGSAPGAVHARFAPPPPGQRSHSTVTAIEVVGDTLVVREGDASIRVPLRAEWTTAPDAPVAASATQDASGRLVVDVVFLDTPHRIELTLDPTTATFHATWPHVPLVGAGIGAELTSMRAPD